MGLAFFFGNNMKIRRTFYMWGMAGFLMCPEWPKSYIYPVLPLSDANFEGGAGNPENENQQKAIIEKLEGQKAKQEEEIQKKVQEAVSK